MPTINDIMEKYKDVDKSVICAEYLEELLCAAREQLASAVGKKVLLVVGKTGAGKSTLVRYLQGYRYESYIDEDTGDKLLREIAPENPPLVSPMVGHAGSCTLVPAIYSVNDDTYFCDTAGIGDSRGETERAFAFIVLQMVARVAGDIKGIICVAEEPTLFSARSTGFIEIAKVLHSIIRNDAARDAILLVTNRGTKSKDELVASIKKLIRRTDINDGAKDVIEMFVHTKNIISNIDITSADASNLIISQVFNNTSIDRSYLSITNSDAMDQSLRGVIEAVVVRGNALLDERDKAIGVIERKTADLTREEGLLRTRRADVRRYQGMIDSDNQLMTHADVERIIQERDRYEEELRDARSAVVEQNSKIKRIVANLNKAKANTTEVSIHQASWDELAILGPQKEDTVNKHKFYYNSGDVPITDIRTEGSITATKGSYGSWSGKSVNGSVAEITYSTPSHVYGRASFKCLAQTRFTAAGKAEINNQEESLKREKDELTRLSNERDSAQERYDEANRIALPAMTRTREALRDIVEQLNRAINKSVEQINNLNDELRSNRDIKANCETALQQPELKSRIKMVYDIYCVMQIDDERTRVFIEKCRTSLEVYRNMLANPIIVYPNAAPNAAQPGMFFTNAHRPRAAANAPSAADAAADDAQRPTGSAQGVRN